MSVQDRFSLHRYSLGSADNKIQASAAFACSMNVVAGAAVPIDSTAFFGNQMQMISRITAALPAEYTGNGMLSASAEACADISSEQAFNSEFLQKSTGHKDIFIDANFESEVNSFAYAARDLWGTMVSDSGFNASVHGSKEIKMEHLFSAALTMLTAASTEETESASFEVVLPPGAELRIDSNAFTVTLNGENILYLQSGAWINISRDLLRLDIESASGGGLSGTLVYTERYL